MPIGEFKKLLSLKQTYDSNPNHVKQKFQSGIAKYLSLLIQNVGEVCYLSHDDFLKKEIPLTKIYDCFGSTKEFVFDFYKPLQEYTYKIVCECLGEKSPSTTYNEITIDYCEKIRTPTVNECKVCNKVEFEIINFKMEPIWLIIHPDMNIFNQKTDCFKTTIEFENGNKYKLLACVIGKPGHFQAIFYINSLFYLVDDIDSTCKQINKDLSFQIDCFIYMNMYE